MRAKARSGVANGHRRGSAEPAWLSRFWLNGPRTAFYRGLIEEQALLALQGFNLRVSGRVKFMIAMCRETMARRVDEIYAQHVAYVQNHNELVEALAQTEQLFIALY
jgi:hypothetical protein